MNRWEVQRLPISRYAMTCVREADFAELLLPVYRSLLPERQRRVRPSLLRSLVRHIAVLLRLKRQALHLSTAAYPLHPPDRLWIRLSLGPLRP